MVLVQKFFLKLQLTNLEGVNGGGCLRVMLNSLNNENVEFQTTVLPMVEQRAPTIVGMWRKL